MDGTFRIECSVPCSTRPRETLFSMTTPLTRFTSTESKANLISLVRLPSKVWTKQANTKVKTLGFKIRSKRVKVVWRRRLAGLIWTKRAKCWDKHSLWQQTLDHSHSLRSRAGGSQRSKLNSKSRELIHGMESGLYSMIWGEKTLKDIVLLQWIGARPR
jgi:hypothetical protein